MRWSQPVAPEPASSATWERADDEGWVVDASGDLLRGLIGTTVLVPWGLRRVVNTAEVPAVVVDVGRAYGRVVLTVRPRGGRGTARVSRWRWCPPRVP